ncbi:MAG TPA: PAS domain-containing protein [Actinomycetota bacterium]|nr:PAS domain-containing protein [Actinomycetota bacterium]
MPQKDLVLILARDLADKLASAAFVVDRDGTLVYFNERCGEILGRTFAEVGEMKMDDWSTRFSPTTFEGKPIPPEELTLVRAINEHAPAHEKIRVLRSDGASRPIAVTSLPLFSRSDEFVGAMAVFWEHSGDEGGGQASP